jgi:hypothetical protein
MQDPDFPKPTPGYSMLMPFVTVASKGGPHDDSSYVAGWEMGALDHRLGMTGRYFTATLHAENVPQIDLIAMKNGYESVIEPYDDYPEWVQVEFSPIGPL